MYNSYHKKLASYNSYISKLTPEQQSAESIGSLGKNRKRTAAGQKDDQVKSFSEI